MREKYGTATVTVDCTRDCCSRYSPVVVGINLFSTSLTESNRDQIISVLTALGSDAQAYYIKEKLYVGGGGTYSGWEIPESFKKHENRNKYIKAKVKVSRVVLTGFGTEIGMNRKGKVKVKAVVRPTGISL
ncbi:MAG: hypothetical protein BMS9Abin39_0507 [Ignavibacteria bacterium]|nr:MAG: hypothetical protein BMS9Abin39_0507 [Ignavibacteria bacterium]